MSLQPIPMDASKANRSSRAVANRRRLRSTLWWRRRMRRLQLRFSLTVSVHSRRSQVRIRTQGTRLRFLPWLLIVSAIVVGFGTAVVYRHRFQWQKAGEALADKGTLPSLEIAVGAAILGIIGIVFSLSIFSIQEAAQRGTTFTLREYTRDWGLRAVYMLLAAFALIAMLSALQRSESALYRICITMAMLLFSVVILRVYFNRVMRFVDPHFTIIKVANRARKLLRAIEKVERAVQAEARYERARRRR